AGPGAGEGSQTQKPVAERHRKNYTWSELMKRVFAADVLACPHCGGRLRILSIIYPPQITRKILDHLGIPSRPPPVAPPMSQELPFAFEYSPPIEAQDKCVPFSPLLPPTTLIFSRL